MCPQVGEHIKAKLGNDRVVSCARAPRDAATGGPWGRRLAVRSVRPSTRRPRAGRRLPGRAGPNA